MYHLFRCSTLQAFSRLVLKGKRKHFIVEERRRSMTAPDLKAIRHNRNIILDSDEEEEDGDEPQVVYVCAI